MRADVLLRTGRPLTFGVYAGEVMGITFHEWHSDQKEVDRVGTDESAKDYDHLEKGIADR